MSMGFEKNKSQMIRILQESDFEYGFASPIDDLLQQCFIENKADTVQLIGEIVNSGDAKIVSGLFHALTHVNYDVIGYQGLMIAFVGLNHNNAEVRDGAVRAIEAWGVEEGVNLLNQFRFAEQWLEDYRNQVVLDISGND